MKCNCKEVGICLCVPRSRVVFTEKKNTLIFLSSRYSPDSLESSIVSKTDCIPPLRCELAVDGSLAGTVLNGTDVLAALKSPFIQRIEWHSHHYSLDMFPILGSYITDLTIGACTSSPELVFEYLLHTTTKITRLRVDVNVGLKTLYQLLELGKLDQLLIGRYSYIGGNEVEDIITSNIKGGSRLQYLEFGEQFHAHLEMTKFFDLHASQLIGLTMVFGTSPFYRNHEYCLKWMSMGVRLKFQRIFITGDRIDQVPIQKEVEWFKELLNQYSFQYVGISDKNDDDGTFISSYVSALKHAKVKSVTLNLFNGNCASVVRDALLFHPTIKHCNIHHFIPAPVHAEIFQQVRDYFKDFAQKDKLVAICCAKKKSSPVAMLPVELLRMVKETL